MRARATLATLSTLSRSIDGRRSTRRRRGEGAPISRRLRLSLNSQFPATPATPERRFFIARLSYTALLCVCACVPRIIAFFFSLSLFSARRNPDARDSGLFRPRVGILRPPPFLSRVSFTSFTDFEMKRDTVTRAIVQTAHSL